MHDVWWFDAHIIKNEKSETTTTNETTMTKQPCERQYTHETTTEC